MEYKYLDGNKMGKLIVDSNVFINSFNEASEFREESIKFLTEMVNVGQQITMPAHGLFEIMCSLKRLSEKDRKYLHPIILGETEYPIEAIHIDADFIEKYSSVDVPYIKAGDHLFLVVAKHNRYALVTRDITLTKRAIEANVKVYTPTAYIEYIKSK